MFKQFAPGASAPWFRAATLDGSDNFVFDTVAGRHILLLFISSAAQPPSAEALRLLATRRALFDDRKAVFFGVTSNPSDAAAGRIAQQLPGIRWFLDYDQQVARLYGVVNDANRYAPCWLLLDRRLRVVQQAPIQEGEQILDQLAALLSLPPPDEFAPVLVVPNVLDAETCHGLIDLYKARGGEPSGFMRDVNGVTAGLLDDKMKRRFDYTLAPDEPLREVMRQSLIRALLPQIEHAFHFRVTRIERYIVACYDAGGYFRRHRDDASSATKHRRFACSINLNAEEYEGGDLRFPEFGSRLYRAPTGGAVVFSCSMLHEATPVTRGVRYATLPFFYDEAAAKIREAIAQSALVEGDLTEYRAGGTGAGG